MKYLFLWYAVFVVIIIGIIIFQSVLLEIQHRKIERLEKELRNWRIVS